MSPPIPYTVTVDTEEEWDWGGDYPTANLSVRNIDHLPRFQEACDRHGAAVTYFVNYAVMADPAARRVILDLAGRPRVEIGLHVHPWNTPPGVRADRVPARETFIANLPPDLIRAKLESVYALFAQSGLRPTSFRGGRYSTGPAVQDFLRAKGFVADCSVLPFCTWPDDGAPDHRRRRLDPVRVPGDPPLWELPLTMGFTRRPFGLWHRAFEAVANTPLRHLRLIGIAERAGLVRKAWLSFESVLGRRPADLLRVIEKVRPPAVDFCIHSSSLIPGGSGFVPTPADVARVGSQLDDGLGYVAARPDTFRPATVTEVATLLEKHHACSRH
jgi:hypothetical protein